jgi:TonB-linked SusC/RagA family outer membrane protein
MKKNKIFNGWDFHCLKKTIRIMRIAVFLMLLAVLQTLANESYSQKTKLTLEFSSAKLTEVLDEIENQTEFYFLFNEKLVDTNREVNLSMKNQKIEDILTTLFAGTDIVYTITDRKIILAPSFLTEVQQPQHTISGKVRGTSGESLPGVTVSVKGKTQGTVTDANGNYSLSNVSPDAVLVFSFVGMRSQEVPISGKTTVNVLLTEEIIGVREVVVVGYGTQEKINVTGSISAVSAKDLQTRPVTSVAEALQGLVPNLQISTTNGGTPGSPFSWEIRGIGSIGGADDRPLILIDGVEGNPNYLNPDDIESVSVLKDAAASAIYGSRAPFGVIIITTKKGKSEQMKLSFSSNVSSRVPTKMLNTMGSLDFMKYLNEGAANLGNAPQFDQAWIDSVQWNVNHPEIYRPYLKSPTNPNEWFRPVGVDIDWFGATYKHSALAQNYNVNASGGSKTVNYYVSLGYFDQEGLFRYGNDVYKRYTGLVNLNMDATKWLEIGIKLKISRGLTDSPNAPALETDVYESWPIYPIFDANGHFSRIAGSFVLQDQGGRKKTVTDMFNNMLTFVIKPYSGFRLSGDATFNLSNTLYRENQKVIDVSHVC